MLPDDDDFKKRIEEFFRDDKTPVSYATPAIEPAELKFKPITNKVPCYICAANYAQVRSVLSEIPICNPCFDQHVSGQ